MNTNERISYTESFIDFEWEIGGVIHVSEEQWQTRFLDREDVDPTNEHKPYGLVPPQLVRDEWRLAICIPLLLRPVEYCGERDMGHWLTYWIAHLGQHFVVLNQAVDAGEMDLPLAEIERRVHRQMEDVEPFLTEFAEKIKTLSQME